MNHDCEKFERLISDRLDSELSPADEQSLRAHLSQCESCRRFEQSALSFRERLRSLPGVEAETRRQHSVERVGQPERFWLKRVSLPLPIAAVLAVLMLAGWLLALRPGGGSTSTPPPRPAMVRSVEIIRVEPAEAMAVEPGTEDSMKTKEDGI